ncbi:hypothetical protein CEV31_2673 [Brucella thiophenivorans]|uniref:Uncharacterized protein n=1 Tax=Brucella thiophenivorans TaxID=571255 RepID=A0A256FLZ1_9HYPH|nr:hypothetical protein CEV31_2673 [Brucella thiophenivorans]
MKLYATQNVSLNIKNINFSKNYQILKNEPTTISFCFAEIIMFA